MCWLLRGSSGSPRGSGPTCFHARRRSWTTNRPQMRDAPGSFFRAVFPPQSSFVSVPARYLSVPSATYQGSVPLRGIIRPVHSTRQLPRSRYVPPSGFLNLSAVCSGPNFAGLFHPATTSRVHPVQGLLPPCSYLPSSGRTAPMPLFAPRSPPESSCHARHPRLRGFFPHEEAFLRFGDQPPLRSLPSSSSSPSRSYSPSLWAPVTRGHPLVKFIGSVFELAFPTLLQRIPSERSDCTISSSVYLLEVSSHLNHPNSRPEGQKLESLRLRLMRFVMSN
jgi:hypothetical protein